MQSVLIYICFAGRSQSLMSIFGYESFVEWKGFIAIVILRSKFPDQILHWLLSHSRGILLLNIFWETDSDKPNILSYEAEFENPPSCLQDYSTCNIASFIRTFHDLILFHTIIQTSADWKIAFSAFEPKGSPLAVTTMP